MYCLVQLSDGKDNKKRKNKIKFSLFLVTLHPINGCSLENLRRKTILNVFQYTHNSCLTCINQTTPWIIVRNSASKF